MLYEASVYRIKEGKIAEQWCFPDDGGLKDNTAPNSGIFNRAKRYGSLGN